MTTVISRTYHFESAHFLPLVPEGHKCKRVHGHNYKVEVRVMNGADALDRGFVIDFWDLDKLVDPLIVAIDHRLLNDIEELGNPTAELIARWFWNNLADRFSFHNNLHSIIVWETETCSATYFGP